MLVAVAAMAFTACQNEPEVIVNNGAESTTITFDATFADTRSQFGEKDGEGYPSTWTEGDEAKFTAELSNGDPVGTLVYTAAIDADDRFSVEFTGGINVGNIVNAYAPASAWDVVYKGEYDANVDNYVYYWKNSYSIPSTQTPSATSVDPKAHILKATTTYEGANSMTLNFEHQVAYGKLSLQNYDGADVTSVVLDINGTKYTINTTAMENIWFACEPATVQNMTVSVNATEGAYTRQIVTDGDKSLVFTKGRVSTFTVDFYGITTGEAVDTFNPDVRATNIVWDAGYYKMTGETVSGTAWGHTSDYIRLYLNEADRPNNNSIVTGHYTGSANTTPTQGQFACRMSLYWGNITYPSAFGSSSTLDVTFADGEYTILISHNGTTYGYKGMPAGWSAPGKVKTALATPEVTAQVVDDKNVTVTWNEVANAANYTVSVNGVEKEAANTSRTYTIEGTYSTEYTISVVANPAVDSEDYKASAAGSATVTTSADPNAEEPGEEPEEPAGDESVLVSCKYIGQYEGMLNQFQLKSESGNTVINLLFGVNYTSSTLIYAQTYTSDSSYNTYMADLSGAGNKVCVNMIKHTIDGQEVAGSTTGSTVTVTKAGSEYTINITLSLSNGQTKEYTFVGSLS